MSMPRPARTLSPNPITLSGNSNSQERTQQELVLKQQRDPLAAASPGVRVRDAVLADAGWMNDIYNQVILTTMDLAYVRSLLLW